MAEENKTGPPLPAITEVKPSECSTEIISEYARPFRNREWKFELMYKGFIGLKHIRRELNEASLEVPLTFKVDRTCTIYLAYPTVIKSKVPWLHNFARHSVRLKIEECDFEWAVVMRHIPSAGPIALYRTSFLIENVLYPYLVLIGANEYIVGRKETSWASTSQVLL
jgi:hypothetical protein